jgi:uncharacterized repeat protein (TIGR03803 family)
MAQGLVVRSNAANLYGTTLYNQGDGTVYKLDPSGNFTNIPYL